MPVYNAGSIVGATLYAASAVPIYNVPPLQFGGTVMKTIPSGGIVGVVYSYVTDSDGTLYWEFYDMNGQPYYAANINGYYQSLAGQGILTTLQQQAAQNATNNPPSLFDNLKSLFLPIALIIGGAIVLKGISEGLINKQK